MAVKQEARVQGLDGLTRSKKREEELNKLAVGTFSGQGSKEFLRYLRSITIESACGPHVSPNELFHREGMRFLVGLIEQRIARGNHERTNDTE